MADTLGLTDLQVDIMRVLWRSGEATVAAVHAALSRSHGLAQPTIATLLSRLEKKGAVTHRTEGRQFVYRAAVAEAEVRRSMLSHLADRLFGGDVPELMSHLLSSRDISRDDLDEVKALIAQRERELKSRRSGRRRKDDER